MIKRWFSIVAFGGGAVLACAQTAPVQTPQTYPNNQTYPYNYSNNPPATGGLVVSNRLGQQFSANDLAVQLQNLRSVVDQTLPILNAFNETYSNSVTGNGQTVGGALSGIVSDVLHRNQPAGQNQSSFRGTNLLAVLHGLLSTNSANASNVPVTGNAEDLKMLETDLQPVASLLLRLNVTPAQSRYPNQYNNGAVPMPNPNLPPTGR